MKSRDETITSLLEVIEEISETLEDIAAVERDFDLVQPIVESLREEITSLYEA